MVPPNLSLANTLRKAGSEFFWLSSGFQLLELNVYKGKTSGFGGFCYLLLGSLTFKISRFRGGCLNPPDVHLTEHHFNTFLLGVTLQMYLSRIAGESN